MIRKKIIACDVMKEELMTVVPQGEVDYEYLSMGLHDYPDKLRSELQTMIDSSEGYDLLILGFGFCGQAASGLKASCCRMIMPRIHECIPLLLGCRESYEKIKEEQRGTYFLTGGWTEGDKALIAEFRRTCDKFGEKEAAELFEMMFGNYSRLMYINTCHPRNLQAKQYSEEAARLLNLNHQETEGNIGYLERLVNGPWDDEEFVVIEKGELVSEQHFR